MLPTPLRPVHDRHESHHQDHENNANRTDGVNDDRQDDLSPLQVSVGLSSVELMLALSAALGGHENGAQRTQIPGPGPRINRTAAASRARAADVGRVFPVCGQVRVRSRTGRHENLHWRRAGGMRDDHHLATLPTRSGLTRIRISDDHLHAATWALKIDRHDLLLGNELHDPLARANCS